MTDKCDETPQEGIRRDPDGTEWLQITSDPVENGKRFWRMLEGLKLTACTKPKEKTAGEQQVEKATDQEERSPGTPPVQSRNQKD